MPSCEEDGFGHSTHHSKPGRGSRGTPCPETTASNTPARSKRHVDGVLPKGVRLWGVAGHSGRTQSAAKEEQAGKKKKTSEHHVYIVARAHSPKQKPATERETVETVLQ